jgi:hypothetical protein
MRKLRNTAPAAGCKRSVRELRSAACSGCIVLLKLRLATKHYAGERLQEMRSAYASGITLLH